MPSLADAVRDAFLECREMDASLGDRLHAFATSLSRIDPAFAGAVDRLVTRLQQAKVGASAPKAGDLLPPFYLPDERGRIISLPEMVTKGPLAVVVHRGHWCPYCRINTRSLAEAQPRIEAAGGQVVAIVPDRQRYADQTRQEAEGQFQVLVDMDNGYAMSLNLVFWVGDEMRRFMSEAGINLAEFQGNESWMVPVPATFVVGKDGMIRERFVDPDYRKRMTVESMLAAFRA
jgi:peroxiredoxin